MRRGAALVLAATLLAAGPTRALEAQDSASSSAPLSIRLSRDSAGALRPPLVEARHLIADPSFEGALRNGFPVRFGFRLGLWRDARLYDRLEGEATWDGVVALDPVSNTYQLVRSGGAVETFTDLGALDVALSRPYVVDLLPPRGGNSRYYYLATLSIESLSLSELEDVERWLKGDLGRAITHRGDVGNAFSRGARLLLIRLSGLPRRELTARTEPFRP